MKVTKEQAQWLIEKMKHERKDVYWNALIGPNEFQFMERILNQCTEKEFPGIPITRIESGTILVEQYKVPSGDLLIGMRSQDAKEMAYIIFRPHQFKAFTVDCNKIMEYLNEKDN